MKKLIGLSLLFLLVVPKAYANGCEDDVRAQFQTAMDAQIRATANDMAVRGISSDSDLYKQQMDASLAPL